MSYRVNHINKKQGSLTYTSLSRAGTKKKKQSRNKQVCIGKLDPVTGELKKLREIRFKAFNRSISLSLRLADFYKTTWPA